MFDNNTDAGKRTHKLVMILVVFFIIFLGAQTLRTLGGAGGVFGIDGIDGINGSEKNSISVSGKGELVVLPDIATITFAVVEQAKTVAEAQSKATSKMNFTLDSLKALGIEERDIKTTDYNAYPRYEYFTQVCTQYSCPPSGGQTIVGYEVRQSILVKIRKIEDAPNVLATIGKAGVSDISGLNFTVDNQDEKLQEARRLAIEDAKAQAKTLAKDLGVKLGDIISFSESGDYPMLMYSTRDMIGGMGGSVESAPQLPTGENKIISNVTITYEIR